MEESSLDLSEAIRVALLAVPEITALLSTYAGEPAIFARRPVPGDATYPLIVIPPSADEPNADGLAYFNPIPSYDINCYASNDQAQQYRMANRLAYLVRNTFHRQRNVLSLPADWGVVEMRVLTILPTNQDDQIEGRTVTVEFSLCRHR